MQRLILHIGNRKVGSTSIQHAFAANQDALAQAGVFYPKQGRGQTVPAHHNLAYEVSAQFGLRFDAARGRWHDVLAEADSQDLPTVVLSTEALSLFLDSEVAQLAPRLEGRNVEIVLYLRRHDLWFQSTFNQYARFGRLDLDIDAWLHKRLERKVFFRRQITTWSPLAPVTTILTRNRENVVATFAQRCGVDPTTLSGLDVRRNQSVPLKLMVAASRLREELKPHFGEDFRLRHHAAFALSRFFKSRSDWLDSYSLLSLDHARRIEASLREETEELAVLTGQRFEPIEDADYANYVSHPMAYADRFDDEETAFIAKMRGAILRHQR